MSEGRPDSYTASELPPRPADFEEKLLAELGGGEAVIEPETFDAARKNAGFAFYKRGTFKSEERGAYLYMKQGGLFPDEATARAFLASARDLTAKGVLYPDTKWGIVRRPSGNFLAFAVMRALVQSHRGPQEKWKAVERPLRNAALRRAGITDENMKTELDNPDSPVFLIDQGEVGHSNNWGWSEEHGEFFPFDVEVVMMNAARSFDEPHERAVGIERAYEAAKRAQKPPRPL